MRPRAFLVAMVAVCAAGVRPAAALEFIFNASGNVTQDVMNAFNTAAARWEANLTDNITVRVDLDMGALDGGALAVTNAYQLSSYSYSQVRGWLSAEGNKSADDLTAVANLPSGTSVDMLINRTSDNPNGSGSLVPYLDNDGGANNTTMMVTRANLKALGARISQFSSDASITVNTGTTWDYSVRDGVVGVDLAGVAMHELGHALGFVSGTGMLEGDPVKIDDQLTYVTPLDLFRFSADSAAKGAIDWTADKRDKYFSIDGGATKIASFAAGVKYGDGYQSSHWKDAQSIGIMDPTIYYGEVARAAAADRRALDVIGYTLNDTFAWMSGTNGSWTDTLNWNTNVAPYGGITAVFDQPQTYTATVSSAAGATGLRIRNGNVTFALSGGDLSFDGDIRIGDTAGPASVAFGTSGTHAVNAAAMYVGGSDAAAVVPAAVTIGAGSKLSIAGTMRIWSGSSVDAPGSISAATIVNSGSFSVSGAMAVSGSFTNLAGNASIGGAQMWGEGAMLHVGGGSVELNSDAGATGQTLAIDVAAGAKVRFNASQHLKVLTIDGGNAEMGNGALLVTKALAVAPAGTLDLGGGAMVVQADEANADAALAEIAAGIGFARNTSPALWEGTGITSSAARDDASRYSGLAAVLNQDALGNPLYSTFEGQAVDVNSILVKYTYDGDADLNGVVDGADYFLIDMGYLSKYSTKPLKGWYNGDFDYNGIVDGADYFLIDVAYLSQYATAVQNETSLFAAAVPEPGGAIALVLGVALLRRRR